MGSPRYKEKVLRYITEHPGLIVTANEIAEALGITEYQAKTAMYTLRTMNPELRETIVVITPGGSWKYLPNSKAAKSLDVKKPKRIFEELQVTKAGTVLVQSEDGTLYLLKELDI